MPFDFKNSPTLGDLTTNGGVVYRYDGTKWTVYPGGFAIPEAPTDGRTYGRQGSTQSWLPIDTSGGGGGGAFLPLTGGTVTGATTFSGGLTASGGFTFQGGSGGLGSIYTDANWGGLIRGRSGAVADVAFQTSGGTVALEVKNTPAVIVNNVQLGNNNGSQALTAAQTPTPQINFGWNLSGTSTASGIGNNVFNLGVPTDTLAAPGMGINTLNVLQRVTAGWQGSRVGINVRSEVTGATDLTSSAAAGNGAIVALGAIATSQNNQGGVATGYGVSQFGLGSLWGAVIQSTLQAGATYYNSNVGMEIDSTGPAGTHAIENVGLKIVQYAANMLQGMVIDVAMQVGGDSPGKGWKAGYVVGSNVYGFGMDPNGYGVQFQRGANATLNAVLAGGIDLAQVDFTGSGPVGGGFAYRSQGTQILNAGGHQIGPGLISFSPTALSIDTSWRTVSAVAVASGGSGFTGNDVLYGPNGTVLQVTGTGGGGAVTTVTILRAGWASGAALPSNPVAFTAQGRVGPSIGQGATFNLTWAAAVTQLALQPSGGAVTTGGDMSATGTLSAAAIAAAAGNITGLLAVGTIDVGSAAPFSAIGPNLTVLAGGTLDAIVTGGTGAAYKLTPNIQTASYTLAAADVNKMVVMNAGTNTTVTVPSLATIGANNVIDLNNINTGVVTVTVGASNGTIDAGGTTFSLVQGGFVRLTNNGTNWLTERAYGPTMGVTGGVGIGNANTVTGSSTPSFALGSSNNVSANGAVAIGTSNVLSSQTSWAIGLSNTITAGNQVAIGANNQIGGSSVNVAIGQSLIAGGTFSTLIGRSLNDRNNTRVLAFGWGGADGTSPNQGEEFHHMNITSTSTVAVRLTTDNQGAGFNNTAAIANKQVALVDAEILITDITNMKSNAYYTASPAILSRGTAVATTVLTGMTLTAGPTHGGGLTLAAAPTISADTTFGGLNVSFTPPAGNTATIRGQAYIRYRTARYN